MAQFDAVEIEKSLQGVTFPAAKEIILTQASINGADQVEIDVLNMLIPGIYNSQEEIIQTLLSVDSAVKEAPEEAD